MQQPSKPKKAKKAQEKRKLTDMQERFVHEYLVDMNATQAAIRAGYTKDNAQHLGYQLLQKAPVLTRIQEKLRQKNQRLDLTADRILLEMYRLATVDMSEAYDENGKLKNPKDMPEDLRRAIAGIEVFEEYEGYGKDREYIGDTKKLKFFDKNKSLEMLGKHFKILKETVDINVGGLADRIEKARSRRKK